MSTTEHVSKTISLGDHANSSVIKPCRLSRKLPHGSAVSVIVAHTHFSRNVFQLGRSALRQANPLEAGGSEKSHFGTCYGCQWPFRLVYNVQACTTRSLQVDGKGGRAPGFTSFRQGCKFTEGKLARRGRKVLAKPAGFAELGLNTCSDTWSPPAPTGKEEHPAQSASVLQRP